MLIAFCFGAFLEGTGGGGAPVAIAGAFLIGLGFPPFEAAVLCLIANTAPVAWGGVGNPIRVLAGVTGLRRVAALGDGRPHPAAVLADPADLAGAHDDRLEGHLRGAAGAARGRRLVRRHAVLLVELSSRPAWSTSPSALFSLLVTVLFLKVWQPSVIERVVAPEAGSAAAAEAETLLGGPPLSAGQMLKGWSPFIVASVFIFVTGLPAMNTYLQVRRR